jgi:hypothetical protein
MSESGSPEGTHQLARRRHTRQLITSAVSVFVVLGVIALLEDHGDGPLDTGRFAVRLAVTAVVMILVTLAMLGLRRAGVRWLQPSPAMGLDRSERRAAAQALRPGGVVSPEHRASTVMVARDVRRYPWAPWFFLLVGAVNCDAFTEQVGPVRWIYGAGAVIGLFLGGYYIVALRKARAIESGALDSGAGQAGDGETPA